MDSFDRFFVMTGNELIGDRCAGMLGSWVVGCEEGDAETMLADGIGIGGDFGDNWIGFTSSD